MKDTEDGRYTIVMDGGFAYEDDESLCDHCVHDPVTCECTQMHEEFAKENGEEYDPDDYYPPLFCKWFDECASEITDGIEGRRQRIEMDPDEEE